MNVVVLLLSYALAAAAISSLPVVPHTVLDELSGSEILAHIRLLADPLLEGRFPGTRGETLSATYIASVLQSANIAPAGDNGTYFQAVPLRSVTPTSPGTLAFFSGSGESLNLTYYTNFVGPTQGLEPTISISEDDDVVFAGYGIVDSDMSWDDYKNVNVTGKVVVVLLGQPYTDTWASKALVWGGRYNGKVETAAKKGAKALLMINTVASSGYSWTSLQAQNGGTVVLGPSLFSDTPLKMYSWVSDASSALLAHFSGADSLTSWYTEAQNSSFIPRVLPVHCSITSTYTITSFKGKNVVGQITGTKKPDELVVLSAHHDHLGMRADGGVYTGAIDNAAGVSIVLAIANALGRSVYTGDIRGFQRSVVFMLPTAEESGLHGSYYYVHSTKSAGKTIVANINLETPNPLGATTDLGLIGKEYSTLGTVVIPAACAHENLTANGDPLPTYGLIYRGDQWSFLREDIPSVWIEGGNYYVGKSASWGLYNMWGVWMAGHYHQTTDAYSDSLNTDGMVQIARVALRTAYSLCYSSKFTPSMLL